MKRKRAIRHFGVVLGTTAALLAFSVPANETRLQDLHAQFKNPPMDCRPHTFWFWPYTAVTREEITWELQQMRDHGLGGVLIWTAFRMYEKGCLPYLSDEYLDLLKHTVTTAHELGMKVSITPGPGFSMGGYWVPPAERSKSLVAAHTDIVGPHYYSGPLPAWKKAGDHRGEIRVEDIPDEETVMAVQAARIVEGKLDPDSWIDLSAQMHDSTLTWQVPGGVWRLVVFRLKPTGYRVTARENDPDYDFWGIDYFSEQAVQHYCQFLLTDRFAKTFGSTFGKSLESIFIDSFELPNLPQGIYWSDSLLIKFKNYKGYDLTPYLPAIWYDMGEPTPKIRYDVNEFLHHQGLQSFFKPFLQWCSDHGVQGAIEPYGFTTDVLQGAGISHTPIMEITPGEKDAVPWFDTRIGPKRYVASGAHLYGKKVVGTEAYTYIHWELYRSTLAELKIASDGFFVAGANKFYHLGYSYSPERRVTPSRIVPWEAVINHSNIWWPYYPLLSDYITRCCFLLRQGDPVADVAVYSPLANQWTLDVFNARKWTRGFDWGDLGELLIANGYNFDLINDDVLLHHASIQDGKILAGSSAYSILLLPNIHALPVESLEWIKEFAEQGGVVIALERIPECSVGWAGYRQKDKRVKELAAEMFHQASQRNDAAARAYGKGRTYFIKQVMYRRDALDRIRSALDPFVNTLRYHLDPDMSIDFNHEGWRENDGLSFVHRKINDEDLYFISNIRMQPLTLPVTFRVQDKIPSRWNPYSGEISPVFVYSHSAAGTTVPLALAPYESLFLVFSPGSHSLHVSQTDLAAVTDVRAGRIQGLADHNGVHQLLIEQNGLTKNHQVEIRNLPSILTLSGPWNMVLQADDFGRLDTSLTALSSWTANEATRHFSGTGHYEIKFTLTADYTESDVRLLLDVGQVGNIAEIKVNDRAAGVIWAQGQQLDITGLVHKGENRLALQVTNTQINQVAGMKEPPPVPENLVEQYGRMGSWYSAHARGPIGFKPLPASGLLGPVRILPQKTVVFIFK